MKAFSETWHDLKNAIHALSLADELLATTPIEQDITSALQLADEAWKRMTTEQRDFIKACLQARRQR